MSLFDFYLYLELSIPEAYTKQQPVNIARLGRTGDRDWLLSYVALLILNLT